ncbi:MAG: translation initiation factor IF-1 [Candidatus Pacebacteria bacterium]|nr:translation initiation factor IF-1 [Candidatus Paceibacterota bacterium]
MSTSNEKPVRGFVTESLPNLMFRVQLEPEKEGDAHVEVIAYLAGKMKFHRIRVMVGDTVEVLLDPYGG